MPLSSLHSEECALPWPLSEGSLHANESTSVLMPREEDSEPTSVLIAPQPSLRTFPRNHSLELCHVLLNKSVKSLLLRPPGRAWTSACGPVPSAWVFWAQPPLRGLPATHLETLSTRAPWTPVRSWEKGALSPFLCPSFMWALNWPCEDARVP